MFKIYNITQERMARIATAGGKNVEMYDYCGVKDSTAGIAIANVDSEERYRVGNNGRNKFDLTPGKNRQPQHKKTGRTSEQITQHNEKMAARREERKATREAAGIVPAHKQKES